MRAYKRYGKRGFTLVELMIVIAIIGVLAALAIYGVRRYLASAKTSEGKNTIGAIARGAKQAFERETASSDLLAPGANSTTANHALCGTAAKKVPDGAVPKGVKYQPKDGATEDYNDGSATAGWKCLKFTMSQAHYYQYSYTKGTNPVSNGKTGAPNVSAAESFETAAQGDLDGDAQISTFALVGQVDGSNEMRVATQVFIEDEYE
jgi:type IV pilus assembly protein PilA